MSDANNEENWTTIIRPKSGLLDFNPVASIVETFRYGVTALVLFVGFVLFHQRMKERGAEQDEVMAAVLKGERFPAN